MSFECWKVIPKYFKPYAVQIKSLAGPQVMNLCSVLLVVLFSCLRPVLNTCVNSAVLSSTHLSSSRKTFPTPTHLSVAI